ncbi:Jag N-terminal domain-containing protein [Sulfurospirillum barnesii]|uniref:RNA-binding protein KhpB N-terminal domain-containing protein n=1 Tax=Sulfurospirillum barnesii (strain ATCC 700032 / DSM 10660 / SES-3) TaxID=760154 RepID=I3XXR8_SULBS|nr:Jag N-terminal domain-containing protein [Sulfurospirillum barnesii]AFL68742.1 hypothetical protein Sulba_1454 [Sulfurospirillum barnesii SES-3]
MIRVEAPTLQEAYSKAASELSCSVVELEISIIQNGSNGFLGFFKKGAIIEVKRKGEIKRENFERKEHIFSHSDVHKENDDERKEKSRRSKNRRSKNKNKDLIQHDVSETILETQGSVVKEKSGIVPEMMPPKSVHAHTRELRNSLVSHTIDQNFHHEKRALDDIIDEINVQIKHLFQYSCFTLESPVVSKYNEETILIEFTGEDAALLIGKEGYRYKALSYLLYNWINLKYGLNIRLEIAEFLKNQEEMIEKYLTPVIERIRNSGKGQTKILDGVLIKIALEALRSEFPEKYVGIKSGKDGGKFIVVNDFNRKNA